MSHSDWCRHYLAKIENAASFVAVLGSNIGAGAGLLWHKFGYLVSPVRACWSSDCSGCVVSGFCVGGVLGVVAGLAMFASARYLRSKLDC